MNMPGPGDVLLGKYALKRMLGRGGVGVVYEAEHVRLRQRVAVKFLAPEMLGSPQMIERFEREARAMALITSVHVTRVTDVDVTQAGVPFLVMEFLNGHDLQSELRARGALTVREAVHWVREACAGMAVVHAAGIVHRDLKPANLFLVDEPHQRSLKIMDFGISKIAGEDLDVTMTTTTLGTPAYMSPEQVRSAKHIDARADVWSLGVILYRALTGKLPFAGGSSTAVAVAIANDDPEPIESLRPDLPPGLVAVLKTTLQKSPDHRYPSVLALSEALAPFERDDSAAYVPPFSGSQSGAQPVLTTSQPGFSSQPSQPVAPSTAAGREDPSLVGQSLHSGARPKSGSRKWMLAVGAGALVVVSIAAFALTRSHSSEPSAASPSTSGAESSAPAPPKAASAKPAEPKSKPSEDVEEIAPIVDSAAPKAAKPVAPPSSAAPPATATVKQPAKPAQSANPAKPPPAASGGLPVLL